MEGHFGEPEVEEWIWADGDDHEVEERSAAALASGAAELVARWELSDSKLRLLIAGSEGLIRTVRAVFEPNVGEVKR